MTEQTFTCGRRIADGMDRDDGPFTMSGSNKDTYRSVRGEYPNCTYCGSVSPEALLDAIKNHHVEVGPTDKAYKFYVDMPSPAPEQLRIVSVSSREQHGLTAYKDLPREAKKVVKREYKDSAYRKDTFKSDFYSLQPYGATTHAKFYTHHFSQTQGDEFIALWKDHKINWGYPGYPYVRLYIPHTPDEVPGA